LSTATTGLWIFGRAAFAEAEGFGPKSAGDAGIAEEDEDDAEDDDEEEEELVDSFCFRSSSSA
jgi:hypothetical protein